MSERIDHEAEARGWIAEAPVELANAELNAGTAERALLCVQLAQAEATLALVEQQRIANQIALGEFRVGPNELPPFRHLVMRPVNAYDVEPTTDIARALGIGDDDE